MGLLDTFPAGETGKSYLLNIYDIIEDNFAAIQDTLENSGFKIISDIKHNEEYKTRSYQYSNMGLLNNGLLAH